MRLAMKRSQQTCVLDIMVQRHTSTREFVDVAPPTAALQLRCELPALLVLNNPLVLPLPASST